MSKDSRSRANQDHYKVGGRSGGPAGPLDQFKSMLATERARLGREGGRGAPPRGAAAEVEQQLSDLHGHPQRRHSVLDDLPSATGPAGVPAGRKPADPHPEAPEPEHEARLRDYAERGGGGPEEQDVSMPADYAVAEREAAPWAGEDVAGAPTGPRLTPLQSRAVRALSPALKLAGGAARFAERGVRRTLDVLQWLERARDRA